MKIWLEESPSDPIVVGIFSYRKVFFGNMSLNRLVPHKKMRSRLTGQRFWNIS